MSTNAVTLARLHQRIFRPSHDPTRPVLTYVTDITAAIDALFLAGHTLDARAIVDSVVAHLHPSWAKVRDKLERRGGKRDDLLEVVIVLMKYQETEELRGLLKDDAERGTRDVEGFDAISLSGPAPDASSALISDAERAVLTQKPPGSSCDVPADHQGAISRPKQNSQLVLGLDTATLDADQSFDQPIPDYLEFARGADGLSFTTSPVRSTFSDSDSIDSRRLDSFNQSHALVDVNSFASRMGVPDQSDVPDYAQFSREMDQALDAAAFDGGRIAFLVDERLHTNQLD